MLVTQLLAIHPVLCVLECLCTCAYPCRHAELCVCVCVITGYFNEQMSVKILGHELIGDRPPNSYIRMNKNMSLIILIYYAARVK